MFAFGTLPTVLLETVEHAASAPVHNMHTEWTLGIMDEEHYSKSHYSYCEEL